MSDLSGLRQQVALMAQERKRLETRILNLKPYMEGSLVERYVRCGKPNCRCRSGEQHGPFLYLSRKVDGKTRYTYISRARVKEAKVLVGRYEELRRIRKRIRELNLRIEEALEQVAERCAVTWGGGESDGV